MRGFTSQIRKVTNPVHEIDGKLYKICTGCGLDLETKAFRKRSKYNTDLMSKCIKCMAKVSNEATKKHNSLTL